MSSLGQGGSFLERPHKTCKYSINQNRIYCKQILNMLFSLGKVAQTHSLYKNLNPTCSLRQVRSSDMRKQQSKVHCCQMSKETWTDSLLNSTHHPCMLQKASIPLPWRNWKLTTTPPPPPPFNVLSVLTPLVRTGEIYSVGGSLYLFWNNPFVIFLCNITVALYILDVEREYGILNCGIILRRVRNVVHLQLITRKNFCKLIIFSKFLRKIHVIADIYLLK